MPKCGKIAVHCELDRVFGLRLGAWLALIVFKWAVMIGGILLHGFIVG